MGLFSKLINSISQKISSAAHAFSYADAIKEAPTKDLPIENLPKNEGLYGKTRLELLAQGHEAVDSIERDYVTMKDAPREDDEDKGVGQKFIEGVSIRYNSLISSRTARRVENYVRCLTETLKEYESKHWENVQSVERGLVINRLSNDQIEYQRTIKYYADKLKLVDNENEHSSLLSKVKSIYSSEAVSV